MEKIKSFTDLIAWQEGHKLAINVYKTTEKFPRKEEYSLTNQIRRCSISITSNIAEGFSRRNPKEKVQFYYISLGSITELQNQLLLARDINYLDEEEFKNLAQQTIKTNKLVNGLIKSVKTLNT